MIRHTLLLVAGLLAVGSSLHAQELRRIASPPPLPFGLEWGMSEKSVLATLKRLDASVKLTDKAQPFTRKQIAQIARDQGVSEQTVRDAQTWKRYEGRNLHVDDALPVGDLQLEFQKGRLFRVSFLMDVKSHEQYETLVQFLDSANNSIYGMSWSGEQTTMPKFPLGDRFPGLVVADYDRVNVASTRIEAEPVIDSRPPIFHGWYGRNSGAVYGATLETVSPHHLKFTCATTPATKQGRSSR